MMDTAAMAIAWFVIIIVPIGGIVLFWMVHVLPEKIAHKRQHPQRDANLMAPVYQGGALRAQVEIRSAEQKQALAEYARTGQKAFGEVENALAAEFALRERDAILEATVRDSERALGLAQIQYRVGSVDLRAVEQSQLAQRVNLYLALGGGFDLPAMEPVAAQ